MLLSKALQRSLAAGDPSRLATVSLTSSVQEAPQKGRRWGASFSPLIPVTILLLSGLVASRPWIGVAPDPSGFGSPAPASVGHSPGPLQGLAYNLTEPAGQCRGWCLSRDAYTTAEGIEHCYQQCLAHPEVLHFIPALEASAAAAPGPQRTLLFAAWYAEGERGSEVCASY